MNKLISYLKESKEEFHKVTWPSRKDTINYSLMVIVISLGIALLIGLFDYTLTFGVEKLIENTPTTSIPTELPADAINFNPDINVTDVNGNPVDVNVTPTTNN